ncbi:hypothetical protein Sj15T_40840 (plasmid) [Sphingobium sp. TA15]|uniref:Uncharacterized protein n=3 Tax=Sphingomonadaceae TaxID=41297 RepID=A0A401J851_SPHXE|nr:MULTISPECIES: hypothetical protein [Sphingomonadaceae]API61600.1 hypothetical protein BSL82_19440 [Tardibacter chloracetimidivorans]BAI95321.1 hypothetical protein SJA_C1-04870 [Sphingobium indicum UT26S]BDD69063.1 hypothetical protein Sj15T_40840 [Sphingobium sp. TA15]GBH32774.1 hypothetical protein MBESOW_P4005 [Sphingobium xenophagum]
MDELDHLLSRLRDAPLDPRLGGLESRVMAEIARIQAIPRLGATTFGIAAATALFIGIAGSAVPTQSADPNPISPFDARLALAPSTLLSSQ